jgi:hypothetical protein
LLSKQHIAFSRDPFGENSFPAIEILKKYPASNRDAGYFNKRWSSSEIRFTAAYVLQRLQHIKIVLGFYGLGLVGLIHVLL